MPTRLVAAVCLALVVGGCGTIDQMLGREDAQNTRFEVWNQTLDPVFLVDPKGRILSLDACGHAIANEFDLTSVEVRTEAGAFHTFGAAGNGALPGYLVIVATGESALFTDRPPALPPCEGHPLVPPDA